MKTQEVEVQSLDSLESSSAKDELLDDYEEYNKEENLSFKTLLWTYFALFVALLVLLPKVYISNQIYYSSKEISKMYHKYTALKEERAYLKREIEKLRYQTFIVEDID